MSKQEGPKRREKAVKPPSKTTRINHIVKIMSHGAWGPLSAAELAAKWGLGVRTIEVDATEASRINRSTVQNSPELIADLKATARGRAQRLAEITETSDIVLEFLQRDLDQAREMLEVAGDDEDARRVALENLKSVRYAIGTEKKVQIEQEKLVAQWVTILLTETKSKRGDGTKPTVGVPLQELEGLLGSLGYDVIKKDDG